MDSQILPDVIALLLAVFVLIAVMTSVRIVQPGNASIVERLGKYKRTLDPGLHVIVPFIDRVWRVLDLREQIATFPPQPVLTQDNQVVQIETVAYYQITDAKEAAYQVHDHDAAIEQLVVTTLRSVVGRMDVERALTSPEKINAQLRSVLDEATGKWGIRVNRVEGKFVSQRSITASVRRLQSPDVDLDSFEPDDPTNVGILVQVIAGPADGPGEESFDVVVCTPRWLESRVREEGPLVGRHHLIVERYDVPRIRRYLTAAVEAQEAQTWRELAARIGRLGKWEFEDYQAQPLPTESPAAATG